MPVTRRSLLQRAALVGGALAVPGGLFVATHTSPWRGPRRTDHYVVCYFLVGGWDLMLVTDPVVGRDGFHVPFSSRDVVVAGGERLGPAMGPLLPFMDRLAILKGISVDALNHPQARQRMVTGRFQAAGAPMPSSIQTLIAARHGDAYGVPNLSGDQLRPATFRGVDDDLRLEPLRVGSIEQLEALGSLADRHHAPALGEALAALDARSAARVAGTTAAPLASAMATSSSLAREVLASDLGARLASSSAPWDRVLAAANGRNRVARQVRLAVEAVRQDVAPVVTVGTGEFDAHVAADYASHAADVARGLQAVADIAHGLEATLLDDGRTLLDLTTIVVTSEFSRAPSLNELGGKHHWPGNAMLLLGRGVKGGHGGAPTVFGAVDEHLMPVAVNPDNGSRDRGAEPLDMVHGLATLLAMVGVDPAPHFGVDPITAVMA